MQEMHLVAIVLLTGLADSGVEGQREYFLQNASSMTEVIYMCRVKMSFSTSLFLYNPLVFLLGQ